jgi:hypothetical protein
MPTMDMLRGMYVDTLRPNVTSWGEMARILDVDAGTLYAIRTRWKIPDALGKKALPPPAPFDLAAFLARITPPNTPNR